MEMDVFDGIPVMVRKLNANADLPEYATEGAACFDIKASERVVVPVKASRVVPTALAFEVPQGYALLVYSRSGHGFNKNVSLVNSVGVIDSDYRGELKIGLLNGGDEPFIVYPGDRIAQGMVVPVPRVQFVEVDELSVTARGEGGFGSTGT